MGYLSCNAESAISTCDTYNWPELKSKANKIRRRPNKQLFKKIREFTYEELASATDDFSTESFLGKGSHGSVYRAVLDNGKLIAAVKKTKQLSSSTPSLYFNASGPGNCTTPAENEIEILSRVQHPRLVNLLGFCTDSMDRKLIVVEYMPNGSLYDLLHSGSSRPPGWTRRIRFGYQVAKAVHALHQSNPPVIHRDIKSSNVLIDHDGNARLGDFGLSLRGHVEDVLVKCTPPAGTLGYLDPGYLAPGDLTAKSDVFSFGILLLEIISGRNAIDVNYSPPSIVDWAVPVIKRGDYAVICDRRIGPAADPALIRQLAVLAARCVRSTAEKRPPMVEVVECLKVVRKRAHAPPIWNNFRQRVRCVEGEEPLLCHREVYDVSEVDVLKVPETAPTGQAASRRNRKLSSAAGAQNGNRTTTSSSSSKSKSGTISTTCITKVERVVRSKSIGSVNEIEVGVGPESETSLGVGVGDNNSGSCGVRRSGVAVKMAPAVVRLSKSRSLGVSRSQQQSQRVVVQRFVLEFERDPSRSTTEFDMSKLVISSLDDKSDRKILEEPLVTTAAPS
ncbi:serine/threonine-protein kinase-like protein At1g28390 [Humulus lupulus]|uniref:serine/threonine-protein kinase-like protein At1g28390 n=1 Tax=Humulus lupulus TaxID=3486 RepID=UPI002B415F35|nr:serine/threonine-protein kinase-like protein At1g28390 [Humulus lupulus]